MPYTIPTFNITCDIFTSHAFGAAARLANIPCNLAWGKRVNAPATGGTTSLGVVLIPMTLLLPATVDIRGTNSSTGDDGVEVPSGSGRRYTVLFADFVGYGFANAHKGAVLYQYPPFKTPDV